MPSVISISGAASYTGYKSSLYRLFKAANISYDDYLLFLCYVLKFAPYRTEEIILKYLSYFSMESNIEKTELNLDIYPFQKLKTYYPLLTRCIMYKDDSLVSYRFLKDSDEMDNVESILIECAISLTDFLMSLSDIVPYIMSSQYQNYIDYSGKFSAFRDILSYIRSFTQSENTIYSYHDYYFCKTLLITDHYLN